MDNESINNLIKKIEDDDNLIIKKWNEELPSKFLILLPSIIFLFTFLVVNTDKSLPDLIFFVLIGISLVLFGVTLNLFLSKKKN